MSYKYPEFQDFSRFEFTGEFEYNSSLGEFKLDHITHIHMNYSHSYHDSFKLPEDYYVDVSDFSEFWVVEVGKLKGLDFYNNLTRLIIEEFLEDSRVLGYCEPACLVFITKDEYVALAIEDLLNSFSHIKFDAINGIDIYD